MKAGGSSLLKSEADRSLQRDEELLEGLFLLFLVTYEGWTFAAVYSVR